MTKFYHYKGALITMYKMIAIQEKNTVLTQLNQTLTEQVNALSIRLATEQSLREQQTKDQESLENLETSHRQLIQSIEDQQQQLEQQSQQIEQQNQQISALQVELTTNRDDSSLQMQQFHNSLKLLLSSIEQIEKVIKQNKDT